MSAVLAPPVAHAAWSRLLPLIAAVLLGIVLLYRETAAAMVAIWTRSETFAHAYLVAPIVLWLVWRQRHVLAALAPAPSWPWLLATGAAALLWLLGELAVVNAATQMALVAMLVFSVPALIGTATAKRILFPLGFAFFAVPFGEFMMPQMMIWTADFTVLALRLSGIPVYREGLQFVIPSGQWSVVEACSGVRYLIASVMIGTLFAYLNYRSTARRIAFVVWAIVVAIIANWIRAYLIVLTGHLSSNELAAGADHLIYGWVFFGVVIAFMLAMGSRWAEPEAASEPPVPGERADARRQTAWGAWAAAAALLLIAVLPHVWTGVLESAQRREAPNLHQPNFSGWTAMTTPPAGADWQPAFSGAAAQQRSAYSDKDGAWVGLHIGYWRDQDVANKMVSSENALLRSNDARWRQVSQGLARAKVQGSEVALRSATLRGSPRADDSAAQRLVVWQIYWVNGTLVASDWQAKLWGAWHKLLGRGDDAAVLIFYADHDGGKGAAALAAFVQSHLDDIARLLARVRDDG